MAVSCCFIQFPCFHSVLSTIISLSPFRMAYSLAVQVFRFCQQFLVLCDFGRKLNGNNLTSLPVDSHLTSLRSLWVHLPCAQRQYAWSSDLSENRLSSLSGFNWSNMQQLSTLLVHSLAMLTCRSLRNLTGNQALSNLNNLQNCSQLQFL